MKRLTALLLVIIVAAFTLGSCSKSEKEKKGPEKVALENVFLTEKFSLPEDADIYNMYMSGDKVYFRGSRNNNYTDENGEEVYEYVNVLYSTDKTFTDIKEFFSHKEESYWDEKTGESGSTYFSNAFSDNQGGIWVMISSYYGKPVDDNWSEWINENSATLYHYDSEGTLLQTLDCKELLSSVPDIEKTELENLYINQMVNTSDGTMYLMTNQRITAVDKDGKIINSKALEDNRSFNSIAPLENGNLRGVSYNWTGEETKVEVLEYSPATNDIKVVSTLSENDNIMMDTKGNIYTDDYYVVRSVDPATGEETPILDWINSDINCDRIFNTTIHDGEVYTFEWDNNYDNRTLLHLTPAGDGEIIEKYIITLAANSISGNLKNMIIDYNRTSADYRIQVKAYGWEEGASDKFDMDLLAGNVPDLICLDQLNAEKYATKGMLADLGAMLDADDELSRDDFLPNILEAAAIKGKLYRLPASFSARSMMGKTSVVGERTTWTWDDFIKLMKEYPDAEILSEYSRQTLWDSFFPLIIEDFIDYDTGKSNFTDGNFAKFLEYAKTLPAEIDWESYYENIDWEIYEDRYKENKALLMFSYISSFEGNTYLLEQFGEPVSQIGFPTSSGNGNTLYFNAQFAIGANSIYKEQAWDFLKMVFAEEYQDEYVWDFPVIKTVFDKKKQETVDNINGSDDEADYPVIDDDMVVMPATEEIAVEKVIASSDVMVEKPVIGPIADDVDNTEYKERMLKFVEDNYRVASTANRIVRDNDPMIDVIKSEASAYFDSKKSLEETCKIIESRVNLYLAENM